MKHPVYLIAAVDSANGLGKNNAIPWRLPREMAYFKQKTRETKDPTKQNMVVMGRATWESIPEKRRPMPERRNVVITRQKNYQAPGADVVGSLDEAYALADEKIETIFVTGGAQIYELALQRGDTTGIYLTRIKQSFNCEVFFPAIPARFATAKHLGSGQEGDVSYDFLLITQ